MSNPSRPHQPTDRPIQTIVSPLLGNSIGGADSSFVIAEWTDGGNESSAERAIAPLHVHHEDDEGWYVIEGTLHFQLGEEILEAPVGTGVICPHGVPHTFWNQTGQPARYLIIMTPNTAAMIEELHTIEERTMDAVRELFRRYQSDLVESRPGPEHGS
jgi:mannose-6-phosphate isomerase-like protein (cupin superfamily)